MEEGWGILIFAFKRGIKAPLYNAKIPRTCKNMQKSRKTLRRIVFVSLRERGPSAESRATRERLLFIERMLKADACSVNNAVERALRDKHGDAGLGGDELVKPSEQSAAAGEHDAVVDNIGGELGGESFQGLP